ncbi:MAG: hypothetical protein IJU20_02385 [Clostridia bacterium]|nr:hypothetical protein [Clostridia bacterium]
MWYTVESKKTNTRRAYAIDIVAQIFANASGQADNYAEDFFKISNLESLCQNILGVLLSAGKELLVRTLEMQDKRIQDSKERKDK